MKAIRLPTRRVPKRRRPMTVAAGYICDYGIILCADTQETIAGFVKTSTEKITVFEGQKHTAALAGAGNNAVQIEMIIQEICDELRDDEPKSFTAFKGLLHTVLDRLLPVPYYPKDQADVELLIAVRGYGETHLVCTHDNVFAEVKNFECIGSGVITGRSLFHRYYRRTHTLIMAYIVSAYALHHAKRWVDGCGGNSDIFLLPKDSNTVTRLGSDEVVKLERYFDDFDEAVRPLLIACPLDPKDDAKFKKMMDYVTNQVWACRAQFQDFEQVFRRLGTELGWDVEKAWAEATAGAEEMLKPPVPPQS
jgi:20S proteasome alpha/beta subunit